MIMYTETEMYKILVKHRLAGLKVNQLITEAQESTNVEVVRAVAGLLVLLTGDERARQEEKEFLLKLGKSLKLRADSMENSQIAE